MDHHLRYNWHYIVLRVSFHQLFYFRWPKIIPHWIVQLITNSFPIEMRWWIIFLDSFPVFKARTQLNSQTRFNQRSPSHFLWPWVINSSTLWQHANLFWLKGKCQSVSNSTECQQSRWLTGVVRIFNNCGENNWQVVTANIVHFTTTWRNKWEVLLILCGVVSFQSFEEELEKLLV